MPKKVVPALFNLLMFAVVIALAAWWGLRIFTPAPSAAPPAAAAALVREADPVAAARLFGKIETQASGVANVQAMGVFAAGPLSSAILVVDGKPAKVFLIGQEVAPGVSLLEVNASGAVLGSGAARQEARVALRPPAAALDSPAPAPRYTLHNQVLSAPSATGAPAAARPAEPAPGTPQAMPPGAPLPKFDSPILQAPPALPVETLVPRAQ
ncbi:MAG: hypothetical protein RR101_04580 [Burkholderiaceae bacterium]